MIGRREVLSWMGASFALTACTRAPKEEIVPYVTRPPEVTPGKPRFYASALTLDGYATGVLVESHEGRPTKIEGNPDHPASLGATGVFEQAAILSLYDPRRARGNAETWQRAVTMLRAATERGLQVILEPSTSPSLAAVIAEVRAKYPRTTIGFQSRGMPRNAWAGAKLAFGQVLEARYDLSRANVIVALDADFLDRGPQKLRLSRQFGNGRAADAMNRLYAAGPLVHVTSANADHRLPLRAADVGAFALALANELVAAPLKTPLGRDLASNRGRSVVIVGDDQPAEVHALGYAINALLGNIGSTVTFAPSAILDAGADAPTRSDAPTLLVCGRDPGWRAQETVFLAPYPVKDATISLAEAHPLESWGDARAFDGTTSVIQPLVAPLFDAKTTLELLAALVAPANPYDLVRKRFRDEASFRRALKRGVEDDAIATVTPAIDPKTVIAGITLKPAPPGLELVTPLDPRMHDGRFSENAWLLELPQPVTTLTWTNAATLSAATAARLAISDGDEVAIRGAHVPALVVPGQADDVIGLTIGWGHDLAPGPVEIAKTGNHIELPLTQLHHRLEGRDEQILQHRTLAEERARKKELPKRQLTLYQPPHSPGAKWGMAIDLSRCIGCDACMVACQAENNIPSVGADEVKRGRVMHWIRIDNYVTEHEIVPQPMLCQHCEKAPCEYVCPVGATSHSPEGINEMTYNRCVGTRFCSNNCPYKVRRFNWFNWHEDESKTEELAHNPDVTVRERGVMEKCTFCVQRIHSEAPKAPQTACQQACPAGAIVFGDLNDPKSEVARWQKNERVFAVLDDLGTEPRVRYLARIRNPNPEIT